MEEAAPTMSAPVGEDVTVLQVDQTETVVDSRTDSSGSALAPEEIDRGNLNSGLGGGREVDDGTRERTNTEESWVLLDDKDVSKGVPPLKKIPERLQNVPMALASPSTWLQSFFDSSTTTTKMKTSTSVDRGKEITPPYSPLVEGGPTPPLRRSTSDDINNSVCFVSASDDGKSKSSCRSSLEIQRSNLVAVCRLVIEDVIDASLKHPGGMLLSLENGEEGDAGLGQLFLVLEHMLLHGLRVQRRTGILGPQTLVAMKGKELWQILESVERAVADAKDITQSVREMPSLKTSMGRCRAWLRLALMQKKLSDYWTAIADGAVLQGRDGLRGIRDRFDPEALMRSEEDAVVVGGLLVGLNTIDCNLCLKPDRDNNGAISHSLDSPEIGAIDFGRYLTLSAARRDRTAPLKGRETEGSSPATPSEDHVKILSDQKNYLEELNRHLEAKLKDYAGNLDSSKRQAQDAQDSVLKNKEQLLLLQEENLRLTRENSMFADEVEKKMKELNRDHYVERETYASSRAGIDSMLIDSHKRLEDEIENHKATIRELNLQMGLRKEIETAMKLMERDLHEKQDTLIVLRQQLAEVKSINMQLFKKSQDFEETLKHKSDLVPKFEQKFEQMNQTIGDLESRLKRSESSRHLLENSAADLKSQLHSATEKMKTLETDLRIEREWRTQATTSLQAERERSFDLHTELDKLKLERDSLQKKEKEVESLKVTCQDQETALTELGVQLSESRLKMEDLREQQMVMKDATWALDREATSCASCEKPFSVARRKHHCRNCGGIFCHACSDNTMPLPSSAKPVRVCDACQCLLLERCTATQRTDLLARGVAESSANK